MTIFTAVYLLKYSFAMFRRRLQVSAWSSAAMAILLVSTSAMDPAQAAVSHRSDSMDGTVAVDHCSWDHPGGDPFMGSVVDALDGYTDMPAAVRARLKRKMAARQYDDIASISRDGISGKESYEPEIREMHFGTNRVCKTVSRSGWSKTREERGLVYCDKTECIIVPTVCRNVSRITRRSGGEPLAAGDIFPPAGAIPGDGELVFAAPSAGPVTGPGEVGDPGPGGMAEPLGATGMVDGDSPWPLGPPLAVAGVGGGGPSAVGGTSIFTPPVPEPGTWLLLSLGLAGLAIRARSNSVNVRKARKARR
jgi:hypothetical protein